jgi:hypothetical protein
MALAQDQRAMLQLLLERGQSYEDIAGLLGGSRDDVRKRARSALEELGGSDPDREVGLTDYLLGQADPIGRADAVRHLQSDPEALALAEELTAKLRLLAPDADLPDLPQPKKRRRAATAAVSPASPGGDLGAADRDDDASERRAPRLGAGLSTKQTRMIAGIAGGAVILLFIVLAIAGVFGGGDDTTAGDTTSTADGTVGEEVTTVDLKPSDGGDAGGEAIFGIANETQPFLDLRLAGLEPPPEGQTYVIWFLLEEERGYPLAPITVGDSGSFDDRFPIPQSALPVVVRTQFVDISLVQNRALAGDIQDALRGREVLLDYSGESVLRGRIPRLEDPQGTAEDLAPPEGTGTDVPAPEGTAPESVIPEGAIPEGGIPEGSIPEGTAPEGG